MLMRPVLAPDEPPACEVVNLDGLFPAVLLCDHASPRVPAALAGLGLSQAELLDHIGWDPGAADLARRLSTLLDAPLCLSGYSRLCIDCNRPPRVPASILGSSAGIVIPGNSQLSPEEAAARQEALFWPYHRAIAGLLDRRRDAGRQTVLLSIHSFTPCLQGQERPWHVGFMYGVDRRLAELFLEAFAQYPSLCVGDNLPYQVTPETDYSIPVHGEARGLPCVLIEVRNDGLATSAGVAVWAQRLAMAFFAMQRDLPEGVIVPGVRSRAG